MYPKYCSFKNRFKFIVHRHRAILHQVQVTVQHRPIIHRLRQITSHQQLTHQVRSKLHLLYVVHANFSLKIDELTKTNFGIHRIRQHWLQPIGNVAKYNVVLSIFAELHTSNTIICACISKLSSIVSRL